MSSVGEDGGDLTVPLMVDVISSESVDMSEAATRTKRSRNPAARRSGDRDNPTTGVVDGTSVEALAVAIQEKIASGELPVGAWLRQERLAQEMGVSRMPIREALRLLHASGTVEIIRNRGARVSLPSIRDITEVYEMRGLLEGHAGAAASKNITTEQLELLRKADRMFQEIVNDLATGAAELSPAMRTRWHQANTLFHGVIIEASGNRNLTEIIDRLHQKIPRSLTWLALGNDQRRLVRNAADHSKILKAIDRGDDEQARHLLVEHARRASELLLRTFD
jgi:DNA-binding GntR family transcriptional regulator